MLPAMAALISEPSGRVVADRRGDRRHDLPRLAIAALDHLQIQPGLLALAPTAVATNPLNSGHRVTDGRADREQARAHRLAVHVHRTCPALRDATPKLRARQTQNVPQHPQQEHVVGSIYGAVLAVY